MKEKKSKVKEFFYLMLPLSAANYQTQLFTSFSPFLLALLQCSINQHFEFFMYLAMALRILIEE